MILNRLLVLLYTLYLMLGCCSSACAQLQPGDAKYAVQKQITNQQSNRNERELQRQVDLNTLKVKREILNALPGAAETVQVPVTGTATDSRGNKVTVSGTLTITLEEGSTPIPPPIGTVLEGVRSSETGQFVTTAPSGTRLFLTGQNLTQEGTTYLLTIGGERATVLRATTELIEFRAPPVPVGKPNVLILYWLLNNNWLEKGRLPFTVTAAVDPTPIPPNPEPIPPQGANPRIDTITPANGRVILVGEGFGAAAGKVMLDKRPLSVVAWADARIECIQGQETDFNKVVVDLWRPAEGWYTQGWEPLP